MRYLILPAIIGILVFCNWSPTSAMPTDLLMNSGTGYDFIDSATIQAFDKESCEQDCRSRFGIDLYFGGGGGWGSRNPGYYAYAQCIQDCNTRFWKDFDRRTRDLERD